MLLTETENIYSTYESLDAIIEEKLANNKQERSFYIADMSDIHKKHLNWLRLMPRVKPFYAVKCNNLPEIITFLAKLGTGFDCASKQEIEQVLSLGVKADQIIYANPCKTNAFIRHAQNRNVNLMTFDNELELSKVANLHPNAKLLLRIKGHEASSVCKFNMKFGADMSQCYHLLKKAFQLGLDVVGVSFHNGSGCEDPVSYSKSIEACKQVFELGTEIGHKMTLLDIGGGFPGSSDSENKFEIIAKTVNDALNQFFPINDQVEIIAEPGRYYVSSAMTLCTMVIAKREQFDEKTNSNGFMYYLNDGVYGAFNNILYDYYNPEPEYIDLPGAKSNLLKTDNNIQVTVVEEEQEEEDQQDQEQQIQIQDYFDKKLHSSVMWGPTCDSLDCIKRDFLFPELYIGQWIMFKNMGAYTFCGATNFNGFELATVIIAESRNQSLEIKTNNEAKPNK